MALVFSQGTLTEHLVAARLYLKLWGDARSSKPVGGRRTNSRGALVWNDGVKEVLQWGSAGVGDLGREGPLGNLWEETGCLN